MEGFLLKPMSYVKTCLEGFIQMLKTNFQHLKLLFEKSFQTCLNIIQIGLYLENPCQMEWWELLCCNFHNGDKKS